MVRYTSDAVLGSRTSECRISGITSLKVLNHRWTQMYTDGVSQTTSLKVLNRRLHSAAESGMTPINADGQPQATSLNVLNRRLHSAASAACTPINAAGQSQTTLLKAIHRSHRWTQMPAGRELLRSCIADTVGASSYPNASPLLSCTIWLSEPVVVNMFSRTAKAFNLPSMINVPMVASAGAEICAPWA